MNVFLVLSCSAVAFYVFILLALWRDHRKRRHGYVVLGASTDFDDVWGFETDSSDATPHFRRAKLSDDVLWVPVTKLHVGERLSTPKLERNPIAATARKASVH